MTTWPAASSMRTSNVHFSRGSGWHSGRRSDVFFAAMVPVRTAVWKTGPFLLWSSPSRKRARTSGGRTTVACARAVRFVGAFSLTSTMAGRPASSRWLSMSSSDLVHGLGDLREPPGGLHCHHLGQHLRVVLARHAHEAPPGLGHEAGAEPAARREAQARAGGAERPALGGDEPDLGAVAGAERERRRVGLGLDGGERVAQAEALDHLAGRDEQSVVPPALRADLHVLEEADGDAVRGRERHEVLDLVV